FRAFRLLLRDQGHRAVEADGENLFGRLHIGVDLAVLNVWAVAPDAGEDRLLVFRMLSDLARQRQQLQRRLEIDRARVHAPRNAGALRLVAALHLLAELDIGAEPAALDLDLESGLRIGAKHPVAGLGRAVRGRRELAGVAAFGIVRAADEGTELADL